MLEDAFKLSEYTAGEQGSWLWHLGMYSQNAVAASDREEMNSTLQSMLAAAQVSQQQLQGIDDSLRHIDESVRSGTASTEAALGQLNGTLNNSLRIGFAMMAGGIESVERSVEGIASQLGAISATFNQAFQHVLAEIGHCSDSLKQLTELAQTPVQVTAYNHYAIARDAFRRGLYPESLEQLEVAINGDHTSAGYKLDWRFHYLKGTLLLGFADCSLQLV